MLFSRSRRWITRFAGGSVILCLLSAVAVGQKAQPSPPGTVTIHQVQVAFSGSGGGGTLHFQGQLSLQARRAGDRWDRRFAA